ncbi:MAG TPA: hypothetical protein VKM56_07770 [Verrucomicrobiae bacterium]|nr:hypothetical protein [Verrucomicrobiae bacterium]
MKAGVALFHDHSVYDDVIKPREDRQTQKEERHSRQHKHGYSQL